MFKQLSLFPNKKINNRELKPRPRKERLDPKRSTQASYSAWGWLFQITAAIVLGLKYRKNLTRIKVEGETEDIELYFSDQDPIYIQAKSTGKSIEDTSNATARCTDAFNTLINTTNLQKNNYSQLIYISNFLNPLKLSNAIWSALWKPEKDKLLIENFSDDIPKEGKGYLRKRFKAAQNQLKKSGYLYTDKFFDWKKFSVATLIFSRKNNEDLEDNSKECATLNKIIDTILKRDNTNRIRENIEAELYRRYNNNATNFKLKIDKNEICGIFIYKIIQEAPETYLEETIPLFQQQDVKIYADRFIREQIQNIDVINKVLADFDEFNSSKYKTEKEKENAFFEQESEDDELKDYFPLDKNDEEIRKECLKYLTYKIIYKQNVIEDTRMEFNIKDDH